MKLHHPDNRNIAQQCARRAVLSKSILCSFADLLTFQLICRKEKPSFSWYFDYSRTELNASLSGIPRLIPQDRAECDDVGRVGWTPTWKVESWKHRPGNPLNFPFPTNLVDMEAGSQPEYSLFNLAWYVLVAWKSAELDDPCIRQKNLTKHFQISNFK